MIFYFFLSAVPVLILANWRWPKEDGAGSLGRHKGITNSLLLAGSVEQTSE